MLDLLETLETRELILVGNIHKSVDLRDTVNGVESLIHLVF